MENCETENRIWKNNCHDMKKRALFSRNITVGARHPHNRHAKKAFRAHGIGCSGNRKSPFGNMKHAFPENNMPYIRGVSVCGGDGKEPEWRIEYVCCRLRVGVGRGL